MFDKIKISVVMAFIFALIFASTAGAHYRTTDNFGVQTNDPSDSYNHITVELAKQKFRCKLCGKTFTSGLVCAGHIRGNHGKWLIHKYYERI